MLSWCAFRRTGLVAILLALAGLCAQPISAQQDHGANRGCRQDSRFKVPDHPMRAALAGTVDLSDDRSICSGALATLPGRPMSAKGLVLTAGHCVDAGSTRLGDHRYPGNNETIRNLKQHRSLALHTREGPTLKACIETETLLYASMTGQDLAIYELAETFEEIASRTGVQPFAISADRGAPGTGVRAPSGRWENERTCAIEAEVTLIREHVWRWGPLLRLTSGCTFRGGASGSPVLRRDTSTIVGVVGTVFGGGQPCEIHNPCEVDPAGQTSVGRPGTSYAAAADVLVRCADPAGRLDLTRPDCPLAKN